MVTRSMRWNQPLALAAILAGALAGGWLGSATIVEAHAAASAPKDCSEIDDCFDRCQCQYDNCAAACSDTDAACVNRCIASWESCREDC